MKTLILALIIAFSLSAVSQNNFFDFKVKAINGDDFSFTELRGKKIMIVNVASKCGLTPQYTDLQKLYETYKDDNFIIIGFPANNFLSQEPGTNEEIAEFCQLNYGVTFPMMEKISVKGDDMHSLYKWLTTKDMNKVWSGSVSWNFQKFLIDEEGNFVKSIGPRTSPMDKEITEWIENKK